MEDQVELDRESLRSQWEELDRTKKSTAFWALPRPDAEEIFLTLNKHDQAWLISNLSHFEKRSWLRLLALDDIADLLQEMSDEERKEALSLLDDQTRREVNGLLAYAEDDAGGLMTPQYLRLRPEMTAEEAFRYLRAQSRSSIETVYYAYVLDSKQTLLGTVSFRDIFLAPPQKLVSDIMKKDIVTIPENMDREEVSRIFSQNNFMAIPVVDSFGCMKGIVTYDDIVSVVQEEATEDMQKIGGMEALDAPYFNVGLFEMVKKRAGWLMVLFVGELFTASAMGYYESEIQRAVVLALFIPLIISSGGNSGSQASTLIIRALALREVRLRDWYRVLKRELISGLCLGLILGLLGAFRIVVWQSFDPTSFGEHYMYIAATVAVALLGVVLWGTTTGAMLPFILKKVGFDPASASAPFVATLVDVTGLVIYFSVASTLLKGLLL